MDEIIEKQVARILEAVSGFPWTEQAFMLTEIADRLEAERHECLAIEYGLAEVE
jgi:hypothetical protein